MALGDRRYKFTKAAFGLANYKNEKDILKFSFGYTDYHKLVAAGTATYVGSAIASSSSVVTIVTSGLTQPDVPRVLTITPTGTTANVATMSVVVTGTNVEGKVITDSFAFAATASTATTGKAAFKSITSVTIPKQNGSGVTFSIGTTNQLGLNHRLMTGQFGMRVIIDNGTSTLGSGGGINAVRSHSFDAAPTVVTNNRYIELNNITPVTTPNGTYAFRIAYYLSNWNLDGQEGYEQYFTSTSTSSSTTSTSTTTSNTTSTSTSTSISSTSTSSTSSSTSSTSTSTTTLP